MFTVLWRFIRSGAGCGVSIEEIDLYRTFCNLRSMISKMEDRTEVLI